MESLKACPFCGGKAKLDYFYIGGEKYFFGRCLSCGYDVPVVSRSEEEAIEIWNRRAEELKNGGIDEWMKN